MNAVRHCLYLLFSLFALTACGEEEPEMLVQSAKTYIAKKDNKAAIIQLKTALQGKPDLAEARLLLGQTLLDSGDPVSAEVELRKAVALKHPDAAVLPVLARSMLQQGQVKKVTEAYASTELADPGAAADLKTSVAVAFAAQGNIKLRDAALASALESVPDYGPAVLVRARAAAQQRDFDTALKLTDTVLSKTPDNYEAWQLKGDLLLFAKADSAGAVDAHRKALAVRGDLVPTHASIVSILLSQRDVAGATAQVDALKKVAPHHPQTKLLQAELAFIKSDFKAAKELIQQVLKVAPENAKALQIAGAIEIQPGGSTAQAERLLTKSLQKAPGVVPTRRLLAQTYLRSGQPKRALETLEPLLDKPGADNETLAIAAQAHLQNGDPKKAEALYTQAAKQDPADVRSRTALALVEFSKGHADAAYSQLEQLAASDPGAIADMTLINAYFRQAKFDAALKAIDNLERKQPGKPLAFDLRGRAHLGRKDVAAARQSFEKALSLDPKYFSAAASLATLDLADKKPELAKQRFDALLKADPQNTQALLAVANLRAREGANKDEVSKLIDKAVRADPAAAAPRQAMIDHLARSKDVKAALAAAQDAVAAQPDSVELLDTLGRVQASVGETHQAIVTFNKFSELRPKSSLPHLRLAAVYIAMKNNDAARQSLQRALSITPNLLEAQRGLILLELAAG
ncbi:MAG: XrtA/PEP-CTERM system TPR-repeat protein PrsT, partial [Burkholderiaceae bacterium]